MCTCDASPVPVRFLMQECFSSFDFSHELWTKEMIVFSCFCHSFKIFWGTHVNTLPLCQLLLYPVAVSIQLGNLQLEGGCGGLSFLTNAVPDVTFKAEISFSISPSFVLLHSRCFPQHMVVRATSFGSLYHELMNMNESNTREPRFARVCFWW